MTSDIHVGYVLGLYYPTNGGAERYIRNLIRYMSKHYWCTVYATNARVVEDLRILKYSHDTIAARHHEVDGIDVYRHKVTQTPSVSLEGFIDGFSRGYREKQHHQNGLTRQLSFLMNWGFSFGLCKRLLQEKLDLIHFGTMPQLHTWSDALVAKLKRVPSVFLPCFHPGTDHEARVHELPFKLATRIIAFTRAERESIHRLFHVAREKIDVIPAPIDIDDFLIDIKRVHFPELAARKEIPRILFVGRLTHNKGFMFLARVMIRLWRSGREIDLVYLGKGTPESKVMEQELARYNHVFHYSDVSKEALIELYQSCDVLVHPSVVESWGLVFLEAWTQKKPVIGITGMPYGEFLVDGKNGFTVPFLDEDALVDRIDTLLADKALRKRMGDTGFRLVMDNFTTRTVHPRVKAVYESLLRQ